MSNTPLDHLAEARRVLEATADYSQSQGGKSLSEEEFRSLHSSTELGFAYATAHALLAIAEQLRIANLITLGSLTVSPLSEQVAADARSALTEYREHENPDIGGWLELRPAIALALGVKLND